MSLIYITGISTSGKSTIAQELLRCGYAAYDTEHNGLSAWYNKKTGKRVAEFNEMPERTEQWLHQHAWITSYEQVAKLAKQAEDKPIFLCGGAANDAEIRALCSTVIWLKTDENTIRQRIVNERDHDYGKKPHELTLTITGNKEKEAEYKAYGAIMIDATQSVDAVIAAILQAC